MALLNREAVVKKIVMAITKLEASHGFEILSYKRDRGIDILRMGEESVWIREHGYREEDFELPITELAKRLKSLIKYEFPRSRKLRVYQISCPDELNRPRKKL
jgi:hypothetical protein